MAQKSEGVFDAGNHADLVRALKSQGEKPLGAFYKTLGTLEAA